MDSDIRPKPAPARTPAIFALAVLALSTLAWIDVLPGGYRLREFFAPHRAREERERTRHAVDRMLAFARANASAPSDAIAFLGSSTIERFPLDACFPGRPCINRGVASESALELSSRLPTHLPKTRLAGIVLYTGAIDWREEGQSAEVVVERIANVLARLAELRPDVPIALIGLLPERGLEPGAVQLLAEVNRALESLARQRGSAFVSTARPPLTSPRGDLVEEFAQDSIHLNARGYRELARWILEDGGDVGRSLARGE